MRRGNLCAILVCLVLMCITVYLIYCGDGYKHKVYPSQEAIERLQRVSDDFSEVLKLTELELKLEQAKKINADFNRTIRTFSEEYHAMQKENESLKAYVEELEDALVYATEWMDRMMEIIDGR